MSKDSVLGLFRQHADTHPERPALVDRERSFSYRELDRLSDRLAPASRSDRWNTPGATPTARSMPSPSRSPRMPAAVSACCSTTATATSA